MTRFRIGSVLLLAGMIAACGGGASPPPSVAPPAAPVAQNAPEPAPALDEICACTPNESINDDYRHDAKHVALGSLVGQEVTVGDILGWPPGDQPNFFAPRAGRELQMYRISRAYIQLAWETRGDCDLHLEVSASADKAAPRVIVETPVDPTYCPARRSLRDQLRARINFELNHGSGEIATPIPVEVIGLAFRDYDHRRGSIYVATPWELHPAVVNLLP